MTWFKVDDSLATHSKVALAGNAAMGLWVRAGAWASQQLTDGFIPRQVVPMLGNTSQAKKLVAAGLWAQEDGGYRFHDWQNYQPSAAEVAADRREKHEAKVRAGRAGGLASGIARRKHEPSNPEAGGEANGEQNEAPSRPVPSRKEPGLTSGGEVVVPATRDNHDDDPAQQLLDAHEHTVTGRLSTATRDALLDEIHAGLQRATPTQVADALDRYRTRAAGGARTLPGLLPHLLDDVLTHQATGTNGSSGPKSRAAATLALAAQLDALEAHP